VALNAAGQAVGTLTDNGLVSFGDWGTGINYTKETSTSPYFNDEMKIGDKLRIDFGLREEFYSQDHGNGNNAATPQPVPAGTAGLSQTLQNAFNGTYTVSHTSYTKASYTVGANYLVTKNISVYARYAQGFQDNVTPQGSNSSSPTTLVLYEAGARYGGHGITASATVFKTVFKNRQFSIQDTANPSQTDTIFANISSPGIELDFNYRARSWFAIDASGVFQNPKYSNFVVSTGQNPGFNNNVPQRTPKQIWTITPSIVLPQHLGEVYARVKHIGKTFADDGNNVVLPAYTVTTLGGSWNVNKQISLDVSVDNLFNVFGATEGNPRQGLTQTVINGTFYGRTIVGTNGRANLTIKF
jgi:outer membrane receptor protein involved in Fe transport